MNFYFLYSYILLIDQFIFNFINNKDGEYKFCFVTTTSNWISENKSIRFSFRMIVGETEQNY